MSKKISFGRKRGLNKKRPNWKNNDGSINKTTIQEKQPINKKLNMFNINIYLKKHKESRN